MVFTGSKMSQEKKKEKKTENRKQHALPLKVTTMLAPEQESL